MKAIRTLVLLAAAGCGGGPAPMPPPQTVWRLDDPGGVLHIDSQQVILWQGQEVRAYGALTAAPLWVADTGGEAPIGAREGILCYRSGAKRDKISALDPATGKLRWTFGAKDMTAAWAARGRVFVGERRGTLHALNAADGSVLWKVEGRRMASHVIADVERVYVAEAEGGVASYGMERGEPLWRAGTGLEIADPIGVASGRVLVNAGRLARGLRAYDALTGTLVWTWRGPGEKLDDWVCGSDAVYYRVGAAIQAIHFGTGERMWLSQTAGRALPGAGVVYVPTLDGLRALDARTGTPRWENTAAQRPLWAEGDRVVASSDRRLLILDAADGRTLATFEADSEIRSIARAEGLFYLESYDQLPRGARPVRQALTCLRIAP